MPNVLHSIDYDSKDYIRRVLLSLDLFLIEAF